MINKFKYILLASCLVSLFSYSFAQNKSKKSSDHIVTFYIARHGKTILNTLDRVQGWADSPLTSEGAQVARYLGVGLKGVQFKSAYSSDLGRARETARIVLDTKGQNNLSITEEVGLRETNFGTYEGDLNANMWKDAALYQHYKNNKELFEAIKKDPKILKSTLAAFKALDTSNTGEDYDQVKARAQKVLREIAEKEAQKGGGNILLVSHGMAISIFLSDIDDSGKLAPAGHMGNAAVCKVTYKNGKFSLESYSDMSYVENGKKAIEK